VNGRVKRICVRSQDMDDIHSFVQRLLSESGKKALARRPVETGTPSVQGNWTPFRKQLQTSPSAA
jgi:hypothetical protein